MHLTLNFLEVSILQNKLLMMTRHHRYNYNTYSITWRKYRAITIQQIELQFNSPTTATTPSSALSSISDNDARVSYACPALSVTIT